MELMMTDGHRENCPDPRIMTTPDQAVCEDSIRPSPLLEGHTCCLWTPGAFSFPSALLPTRENHAAMHMEGAGLYGTRARVTRPVLNRLSGNFLVICPLRR